MSGFLVEQPGLLTTIQDLGRRGYRQFGLCASGAMDREALIMANWLVGNKGHVAALEATFSGPSLIFDHDGFLAICGADMTPLLNDQPVENNQTIPYNSGDRLSFLGLKHGFRAMIAFHGGIDCPVVMNSRSTTIRAGIGGIQGRALQAGDQISISPKRKKAEMRTLPEYWCRSIPSLATVRIVAGPESHQFPFEAIRRFLTSSYQITPQSDRMGYRLQGLPLQHLGKADILSSGIPLGTIQVPGNGQPIITLADGQPSGGYARIATIISIDLPILAQLKPGSFIRFVEVRPPEAERLYIQYQLALKKLIKPSFIRAMRRGV